MVNFALGNEIKKKTRRCLFPMSWNNLMNIVRLWFATDYSVAQGYSISQRAESRGLVFHLLVWNQIFSFVLSS